MTRIVFLTQRRPWFAFLSYSVIEAFLALPYPSPPLTMHRSKRRTLLPEYLCWNGKAGLQSYITLHTWRNPPNFVEWTVDCKGSRLSLTSRSRQVLSHKPR